MAKTTEEIRDMLEHLESSEKLKRPAKVEINAPLALLQAELEAQIAILKWVLD